MRTNTAKHERELMTYFWKSHRILASDLLSSVLQQHYKTMNCKTTVKLAH